MHCPHKRNMKQETRRRSGCRLPNYPNHGLGWGGEGEGAGTGCPWVGALSRGPGSFGGAPGLGLRISSGHKALTEHQGRAGRGAWMDSASRWVTSNAWRGSRAWSTDLLSYRPQKWNPAGQQQCLSPLHVFGTESLSIEEYSWDTHLWSVIGRRPRTPVVRTLDAFQIITPERISIDISIVP